MKKKICSILITIALISQNVFLPLPVFSADLTSDDYKILDATISSGSDIIQSTDYNMLSTLGDFSSNPRLSSTSYTLKSGTSEIFTANVPIISCFETSNDRTYGCTTSTALPSYIRDGGMERVCGPTGCYDKGHFEIDPQDNPGDTLFGIQVSTTADFSSDVYIVDGVTYYIEPYTIRTLEDYKGSVYATNSTCAGPLTCWENKVFNIQGLIPNTTYYIRATALHGDFTESEPGPSKSSTTAIPVLLLDLDIDDTSGTAETSPSHEIELDLVPNEIVKGDDLIWLDAGTNHEEVFIISQRGEHGSLYLSHSSQIASATRDLASSGTTEGFGLQHYLLTQLYQNGGGQGELGSITVNPLYTRTYSGRAENVGLIDTTLNTIYEATAPIHTGSMSMYVAAKASTATTPGDYEETLTFIMTANY